MYEYLIKLTVEGIGQVTEIVRANTMSQAQEIVRAKYSGRRISSMTAAYRTDLNPGMR